MNLFDYCNYFNRILFKKGSPLNLIFFVTSKCDAKCPHCFYWQQLNKDKKQELTKDEILKIAKNFNGILSVSLTGGEPFLRDDLCEIASIFQKYSKAKIIQIPTNGIQTNRIITTAENILKVCKDGHIVIRVSMDGLEEIQDSIRGVKGAFNNAVETYKSLKALQQKYSNLILGISITYSKINQERLDSLRAYIENELQPDDYGITLIRGDVKDNLCKVLDISYYEDFVKKKIRYAKEKVNSEKCTFLDKLLIAREELGYRLILETKKRNNFITPCYAGALLAIMYEDGSVFPCEMLDLKIGNIRDFDYNFKKLWFSKRAEEVRKKIKKTRCFCTYECAMSANTLFNLRHALSIFKSALLMGPGI